MTHLSLYKFEIRLFNLINHRQSISVIKKEFRGGFSCQFFTVLKESVATFLDPRRKSKAIKSVQSKNSLLESISYALFSFSIVSLHLFVLLVQKQVCKRFFCLRKVSDKEKV